MKNGIKALGLALMLTAGAPAIAQEPSEMPKPDLTGESLDAEIDRELLKKEAQNNVGKDGEAQWYITMDYAGFEFEVPAGMLVDKGENLLIKAPDGTFGVSMSNQEMRGSNQKVAFEVCRKLATELRLPNPKVEKVSFGKCDGARASGEMEGQQVTILVLPYNNKQVTTVMLCTPNRQEWANHLMSTLKR